MTPEQLAEIKVRRAAITPGEWEYANAATYQDGKPVVTEYFVRREEDDVSIAADILDPDTCKPSEANAAFIASAPAYVDALIAEVERLNDLMQECINRLPTDDSMELAKMWLEPA